MSGRPCHRYPRLLSNPAHYGASHNPSHLAHSMTSRADPNDESSAELT